MMKHTEPAHTCRPCIQEEARKLATTDVYPLWQRARGWVTEKAFDAVHALLRRI